MRGTSHPNHSRPHSQPSLLSPTFSPFAQSPYLSTLHFGELAWTRVRKNALSESSKLLHTAINTVSLLHFSRPPFRFRKGTQQSLGKLQIRIPTSIDTFLLRNVGVVNAPIPLLIRLDFLNDIPAYFDNTTNELRCRLDDWCIPVKRKLGHSFIEWNLCDIPNTHIDHLSCYVIIGVFDSYAKKLRNLIVVLITKVIK